MRLTPQTINNASIVLNPEGKLTLQLRNLSIPYLENLGITQNKFAVIDLTNNDITELANIPANLSNLEVLLLGGNRISYVDEETFLDENGIKSLSLINNSITKFQACFRNKFRCLENLVLIGNPIVNHKHYRYFIIWLVPTLKVLDFKKVKDGERQEAEKLFGVDKEDFNELALSYLHQGARPAVVESKTEENGVSTSDDRNLSQIGRKLTPEERVELMKKLESATNLDEIDEIEHKLKTGMV